MRWDPFELFTRLRAKDLRKETHTNVSVLQKCFKFDQQTKSHFKADSEKKIRLVPEIQHMGRDVRADPFVAVNRWKFVLRMGC